MNILHITNGLSEGGVETLLYSFSKVLLERGHSVSILVISQNNVNLKRKFEDLGVKVLVGNFCNPYDVRNIFLIRRYLPFYDIIHIHLFPVQLYAVLANISLGKHKKQLITTEHNTWNNRRKYKYTRYLDKWFYRRYYSIIGISSDASYELIRWLGEERFKDKIATVNNGIEQQVRSKKTVSISDFNCSVNDFILVMVARFDAQKDQETLIRTLPLLPENVHVIFVGSGETLEYNRNLASILKLDKRVFFAGFRDDVFDILSIAHLGVLCSNWEGFGLSIVEYMLAGLPVLASNVVGLKSVVGWDELLYAPKDCQNLADKILKLMQSEVYYNEVKSFCIDRCGHFTIEQMADEYLKVYNKILKNS
ncbi:glycosyltransferase family 4 protein [Bacteroides sp.]|uniref:glycosyltransferase family 4 protein n=1 Tax=Bacteroides sp. TaxID=29523 RepID=UPI002624B6AE|nr:glycosyltransferase family 4 protein [Bacteroides sp.]MDD3040117.1 glycosyltransferase family 4 protein [Bacteroides sp.]